MSCRSILSALVIAVATAYSFTPGLTEVDDPVVTLASAERCVAGRVIVKLDRSLRGHIHPVLRDGVVETGVPELDALNQRWRVTDFSRILRAPRPDDNALRLGIDLQYILTFDTGTDVAAVVADYERCPLVEYACPDALLESFGTDDTPNDPRYPDQWSLPHIRAPQAWDIAHGDTNVVVTVIDMGVNWHHPDLEANLWINNLEDLNGNRRFDTLPPPDGDLDGLDQDGNGYTDDVIGWDFVGGDPNPMQEGTDDHGTMSLGNVNAVTDNDTGIAAPPWNVRSIVLRCGRNGSVNVYSAIAGIYYSGPEGVWAVSMPWGTMTPYEPLADACLYLWFAGALGVGAAGANGSETPTFPAAYDGVIGVAASDERDYKTASSSYGWWIDVCAPGVNILTTSGVSGYTYWSGTSPACNITTGVLAWFKSAYPGIDNHSALALLENLCDSMPDPLYLQGKLGAGRVAMAPDTLTGIAQRPSLPATPPGLAPSICSDVLFLPRTLDPSTPRTLLTVSGRKVLDLHPGTNDLSRVAPGVYFLEASSGVQRVVVLP